MAREGRTIPHRISVRFGTPLLARGFTSVPNLVLDHYTELGVSPTEMMLVIHIWQHWWTKADPYPSLSTIARKMGLSWSQAHRHIKSLAGKQLVVIKPRYFPGQGQATNEYDFQPFLDTLLARVQEAPGASERTPLAEMPEGPLAPMPEEEDSSKKTQTRTVRVAHKVPPASPPAAVTPDPTIVPPVVRAARRLLEESVRRRERGDAPLSDSERESLLRTLTAQFAHDG